MSSKKMMRVVGGEHDGASVEVEDYGWAIRLPLMFTKEELDKAKVDGSDPVQRFQLYYRTAVNLADDDGTTHQIEFLRAGNLSVREAVELRLLPGPPGYSSSKLPS